MKTLTVIRTHVFLFLIIIIPSSKIFAQNLGDWDLTGTEDNCEFIREALKQGDKKHLQNSLLRYNNDDVEEYVTSCNDSVCLVLIAKLICPQPSVFSKSKAVTPAEIEKLTASCSSRNDNACHVLVEKLLHSQQAALSQEKTVMSAEEAKAKILNGECLEDVIIKGDIYLKKIEYESPICLKNVIVEGLLHVSTNRDTKGPVQIFLKNSTITKDLVFINSTINGFFLENVSIGSDLVIREVTFQNSIFLSFAENPKEILVDEKNAQLIHWAAPTIPLRLLDVGQ